MSSNTRARQRAGALLRLLVLAAALAPVSASPVAPPEAGSNQLAAEGAPEVGYGRHTTPEASPTPLGASHGAPMKPILGRREALNIGPPSGLSPLDNTVVLHPLPSQGCTTTVTRTYGHPCLWDGTLTLYPYTTMLFEEIDCNGCYAIAVDNKVRFCPNEQISVTQTLEIPSTYWSTICRPSTALAQLAGGLTPATTTAPDAGVPQTVSASPNSTTTAFPTPSTHPEAREARRPRDINAVAACPTTVVVQPPKAAGRTLTSYSSYSTSTVLVSCHGCSLVVSTALAGYGPPGVFTTTTTLPVGAVTTYACRR